MSPGFDELEDVRRRLVQIESSYTRLLDHLPGMAYRCVIVSGDFDYRLEFVSQGSKRLLNIDPSQLLEPHWNTIERMMLPEDLARVRREMRDRIVAQEPYQVTYRLTLPTGDKWIWDQGEGVYDSEGKAHYLEGIMLDVSEQKLQEISLKAENQQLRSSVKSYYGLGDIVGTSPPMQTVYGLMLKSAKSDTNVIIYGETGVGKDLVAKTIHDLSARQGKYIPVNCAAIPDQLLESEFFGHIKGAFSGANSSHMGYLASAHNGTLFLDEIGELPLHLQVKLLRAIESKMYTPVGANEPRHSDFRLVAATNQDLREMVRQKTMRADFYYRIHVLAINMPPLRERLGDISLLIDAHLKKRGEGGGIPARLRIAMERHQWPGNIRELQNFIDRYITFGEEAACEQGNLDCDQQSLLDVAPDMLLEDALAKVEQRMISKALERCLNHRGDCARMLGLNLRTLQRKMKEHGIG